MGTMLETRYRNVRRHLDKLGYQDEALPVEALELVQRLLLDFSKTSDNLKNSQKRADHFAKVSNNDIPNQNFHCMCFWLMYYAYISTSYIFLHIFSIYIVGTLCCCMYIAKLHMFVR